MRRIFFFLLVGVFHVGMAMAQDMAVPPVMRATFTGRVVDSATGTPMGAAITLESDPEPRWAREGYEDTITGKFAFGADRFLVVAGTQFTLWVGAPGYEMSQVKLIIPQSTECCLSIDTVVRLRKRATPISHPDAPRKQ